MFQNCHSQTSLQIRRSSKFEQLQTHVISKVFERVVHKRIYAFLETFKLLSDSQYGYRSKRSTVDAIVSITEKIRDKNSALYSKCVFLDLSKAFDTIDHETLLKKNASNWISRFIVSVV